MIMLHYYAGSKFDTEFWREARRRACLSLPTAKNTSFEAMVKACNFPPNKQKMFFTNIGEIGTWGGRSFLFNLTHLGIKEKILEFF